jgi:hypothetical protein
VSDAVADWRRGAAATGDFDPAVATGRAAFADVVGVPPPTADEVDRVLDALT